jgi:hypothetical protein
MRHARVVVSHNAPDRPPIRVARGDAVHLGHRDTDWPEFVWTTIAEGYEGWVPATLFDREDGPATALQDYDTRELDTQADEVVTLQYELAGWWWARNALGHQGWVPARSLELLDDDDGEDA